MKNVVVTGPPLIGWFMRPYGCAPKGANSTIYKPEQIVVPSGEVRDIESIPHWVTQFTLMQRVAVEVTVDGERALTTSDEHFNMSCYIVHRMEKKKDQAIEAGRVLVPVHGKYERILWVTTSRVKS